MRNTCSNAHFTVDHLCRQQRQQPKLKDILEGSLRLLINSTQRYPSLEWALTEAGCLTMAGAETKLRMVDRTISLNRDLVVITLVTVAIGIHIIKVVVHTLVQLTPIIKTYNHRCLLALSGPRGVQHYLMLSRIVFRRHPRWELYKWQPLVPTNLPIFIRMFNM